MIYRTGGYKWPYTIDCIVARDVFIPYRFITLFCDNFLIKRLFVLNFESNAYLFIHSVHMKFHGYSSFLFWRIYILWLWQCISIFKSGAGLKCPLNKTKFPNAPLKIFLSEQILETMQVKIWVMTFSIFLSGKWYPSFNRWFRPLIPSLNFLLLSVFEIYW